MTVQALFEAAAAGLVGEKVHIVFRIPVSKNADGCAYLQYATSMPIIEIRPGLSDERREYVFLHEAAHHVLKHCRRSTACYKPSKSLTSKPDTKEQRTTVDDQVAIWQAYADKNQNQYEGDDQARRLRALAWWRYSQIVDAAVKKVVEKYTKRSY